MSEFVKVAKTGEVALGEEVRMQADAPQPETSDARRRLGELTRVVEDPMPRSPISPSTRRVAHAVDEIDGNEVCLIQFLAVHPEVFGVPDVSAPPSTSSCPVKVFEENAAYFRHIASRFALDADEFDCFF